MSNLDILEVALFNIKDKLDSFYHLVADIDDRLVNAENYLLDNGDALNPILSNIDEQSIFTSYSQASRGTRTKPILLEDIHLRATKPTLNNPAEPIQTCNVLMSSVSFNDFNQYFTSTLGDTLHFYVTDLEIPRPSLESNLPFITAGLELVRGCNFKITNDFFTIQPDFRDQTIDFNIRALDNSNVEKYETYDSANYLSDPYTIRIVESTVSSIIKISPEGSNDTITFSHTDYHIRNDKNNPVLFLQTFINPIGQTTIETIPNITSIYYEYELSITDVVFSNVDQEHYSNFNENYYFTFDFRGSNNEPKQTKLEVITYDPLYYQYYKDKKTSTYVIIEEPPPITLKGDKSGNYIETIQGYDNFVIKLDDLFSNNTDFTRPINYSISSNITSGPNRFNRKPHIRESSLNTYTIHTDFRNADYTFTITGIDNNYPDLPTYYLINITELEPPKPSTTISQFITDHSTIQDSNLDTYFSSGTSNQNLIYSLESNNYPTDNFADVFSIVNNKLRIAPDNYFNKARTLKKYVVATDETYNVSSNIEAIFNQKSIIDVTTPTSNFINVDQPIEININNYCVFNKSGLVISTTITSNIILEPPINTLRPFINQLNNH